MTDEDFNALPIGTILHVREEALLDEASGQPICDVEVKLKDVVQDHGYFFKYSGWDGSQEAESYTPVGTTSISTGARMEFNPLELELLPQEEDHA